jgi:hypothetical protein
VFREVEGAVQLNDGAVRIIKNCKMFSFEIEGVGASLCRASAPSSSSCDATHAPYPFVL